MSEPRIAATKAARQRAWIVFTFILVVGFAGAAGAAWWFGNMRPVDVRDDAAVTFEVEPGWGAARVTRELEGADVVRSAVVLQAWLRLQGLDRSIGEGLYTLSPSMGVRTIATTLAAGGRPRTMTFTIPEGWRAEQVAERLEDLRVASREDVLARIERPGDLAPAILPDGLSLEGYLLPETYELRADATLDDALRRPLVAMETLLADGLADRAAVEGLTVHALLTLASMVQAEAAGVEEMAIIAGVFRNRLDVGMPLQSDPTVAYGLGKRLPELSRPDGDFEVDHAWNTYTRGGLPVGPIGAPSRAALDAVLAPERLRADGERWLYFLHGVSDDGPVFRPNTTLAEHLRDVNRYLP